MEMCGILPLIKLSYVDYDENFELKNRIGYCFKCAVCSNVCPVTLHSTEYQTRKENAYDLTYVYDLFEANDEKRAKIAWKCSICHHCIDVCPQDVRPGDIYTAVKEEVFRQGKAPVDLYAMMNKLIEDGMLFPISEGIKRKRKSLGLPPIERPVLELMTIAENTGLRATIKGYKKRPGLQNDK